MIVTPNKDFDMDFVNSKSDLAVDWWALVLSEHIASVKSKKDPTEGNSNINFHVTILIYKCKNGPFCWGGG